MKQITKINSLEQLNPLSSHKITAGQLRNEYYYIRAEQLTRKLMDKGFIFPSEYECIMTENRSAFSPYLADLYPDNKLI